MGRGGSGTLESADMTPTLSIAFLADPLDTFYLAKDSTYLMMQAASARGHSLYALQQQDLVLRDGLVSARCQQIALNPAGTQPWYHVLAEQQMPLTAFSALLLRKDPPFDVEYLTTTWLLERAVAQGARVFNHPRAVRDHNEKLAIAEFPQFTAPTLVSRDADALRAFHAEHGDIVIKPLDGMGGMGIFRVGADGLNLNAIIETLGQNGARTLMAQRYLPEIADGDKRILLVGGEVVPYCLARIPKAGETRGNLAAGGTGVARELTARDREIAQTLAPLLYERGLFLVGLDVIGSHLTEINVTSPTCMREILQQTGFDAAALLMDKLEALNLDGGSA